jgi:Ca2+:H+ antiporter
MKYVSWLLVFAPIALIAHIVHAPSVITFSASALAIVPLSGWLGQATEELAGHAGPTVGGLLNATLGNLAEFIIGAFALQAGLLELVKASITGSILGNLLLVLGAAQLTGGLRYKTQSFNLNLAQTSVGLLVVAVAGLVIPAIFLHTHPDPEHVTTRRISLLVATFLMIGYALSLVYSMGTHRAAFGEGGDIAVGEAAPTWPMRKTVSVLVGSAAAIGVLSETLVASTAEATRQLGLSELFIGLVVVPIVGNAAEHSSAVMMAMKNRMDLAVSIAVGSSIQVALLVAPLLVLLGLALGQPMDLAFQVMEVAAVALAVGIAAVVVLDGRSNWLEGAFLLIVYAMLASVFFYL